LTAVQLRQLGSPPAGASKPYTSARVCFPTDQGELGGGSSPIETVRKVTWLLVRKWLFASEIHPCIPPGLLENKPRQRCILPGEQELRIGHSSLSSTAPARGEAMARRMMSPSSSLFWLIRWTRPQFKLDPGFPATRCNVNWIPEMATGRPEKNSALCVRRQ